MQIKEKQKKNKLFNKYPCSYIYIEDTESINIDRNLETNEYLPVHDLLYVYGRR